MTSSAPQHRPLSVLITGAAGFIGSHLAERLLARGDEVVGVDNFDPFYSPAEKRNNLLAASRSSRFTLLEADCRDLTRLEQQLAGRRFDVIVHLAAKAGVRPSIEDPMGYASANVLGTQSMLEFGRRAGIKRFVFASSSSVYGNNAKVPFAEADPVENPISPYAATKRAGELLGHTYHHLHGISFTALRFFTVYGPRQRPDLAIRKFAELILSGQPIPLFGDGSTARDYTWVDDVVDGVEAAIDRSGESPPDFQIINLGGSRTTTLAELVDLIADASGTRPTIKAFPRQPGDVDRTFADISLAGTLLGYAPRMDIATGVPRFIEWLKAH